MSKTKTLFTMALLILLGSMGAAQAQGFAEVKLFATPMEYAREGGKNEAAGSILLNVSDDADQEMDQALRADGAMIMLHFSVPLAANIAAFTATDSTEVSVIGTTLAEVTGLAEDDDNDGNGTIMIDPGEPARQNLLIQGVKLDVSSADGPVTVTLAITPGMGDFIRIDGPSSAVVIGGIMVGVAPSVTTGTVRTRGTDAGGEMVSLTLKESFKGAFMDGNMVTVEFSGIPEGATLKAELTGIVITELDDDGMPPEAPEDRPMADDPYATVSTLRDGSATVTLGGMEGDFPLQRDTPEKVVLALTLIAVPPDDDEEMSFPLSRGSVMAKASFTDAAGGADNFEDAFTDYVTVFNIRPAQCEILFPVVTVRPDLALPYYTAISVTNPAYADEMASGGLTFTFYGMGGTVEMYDTAGGVDPIVGIGLEADGTLSPGGTYQVLASEILAATGWGETFQGHVHLTADYTHCSGLGWVTDFATVNQAYSAVVIDADTGTGTE